MTDVPPERQKILGLVKGKLPPEEARMSVRFGILHYKAELTRYKF